MSYAIEYTSGSKKKYPKRIQKKWNPKWTVPACIAGGLVVVIVALCNITAVRHFFLPGDPVATENALKSMVSEMKAGESLYDAFTVFCREVIADGMAG